MFPTHHEIPLNYKYPIIQNSNFTVGSTESYEEMYINNFDANILSLLQFESQIDLFEAIPISFSPLWWSVTWIEVLPNILISLGVISWRVELSVRELCRSNIHAECNEIWFWNIKQKNFGSDMLRFHNLNKFMLPLRIDEKIIFRIVA